MKMKFYFLLISLLVTASTAIASSKIKSVRVTYETKYNGKTREGAKTIVDISEGVAHIFTQSDKAEEHSLFPKQDTYINYHTHSVTRVANVNGETIYTTSDFEFDKGLTPQPETETIAGYQCKKAKAVINSNTIEIWYTTELNPIMGTMQPGVGIPEGVVLKVVRNGQMEEVATKVEKLKEAKDLLPQLDGEPLKASAYNYQIQQSQVLQYKIFDKESVYFRDIEKIENLSDTEIMRFANGTILLKKVKFPSDNKDYNIFAELSQYSEGDAYDRTGTVFVIPMDKKQSFVDGLLSGVDALPKYTDKHGEVYQGIALTDDYLPPLELMRFYTSFGVRGYNHIEVAEYNWPDSVVFKQEITDCAQYLKDEAWVGVWIGNYAANGHNVTLDIKFYPRRAKEPKTIFPIFATVNIMEIAGQSYPENLFRNDTLSVDFETDVDLDNAYIRYISTGHGGWGEGDEFVPKLNEIFLDNNRVMGYIPWREDCGSYREVNPASGNFSNGLSSSDLSRSGWCPGTVSYPVPIYLGKVSAGKHNVKVAIPVGERSGDSRSYWNISGALVGERSE